MARKVQFEESDLDMITVGNFIPFQTGQLDHSDSTDSRWDYRSCIGQEAACIDGGQRGQHIPVEHNEPLALIQTDGSFTADNNHVSTAIGLSRARGGSPVQANS